MAVFKAGPWGTPNDPYQPQPDVVTGRRDFSDPDIGVYPINVANNAFGWRSFYSVQKQECATPAQIEVTFPYTDNFLTTVEYHTATIDVGPGDFNVGQCEYLYNYPDATYYDPVQYVFALTHDGIGWNILFGNFYFAYQDTTSFSGDECDPVTSFTISGSPAGYYDGYDITITDPNA